MLSIYFQGFILGAALILPLGPQNTFVLQRGICRQFHLMCAALCALSDIILIYGGIFGGSAVLSQSALLFNLVTWGGVAFLLWYGWRALRSALDSGSGVAQQVALKQGRLRIMLTLLAVTWLNPHVYIDTFVMLGSLGGQLEPEARPWFAFGSVTASIAWFFSLALLASWLSPRLNTVRAQRIINLLVGVVMWGIALKMSFQALNLL